MQNTPNAMAAYYPISNAPKPLLGEMKSLTHFFNGLYTTARFRKQLGYNTDTRNIQEALVPISLVPNLRKASNPRKKLQNAPPAVMGITRSPPATLVPNIPSPIRVTTPEPVPDVSAIQIPKKVPTNAPTAVKNCEPMAWRFVKPDLMRIE